MADSDMAQFGPIRFESACPTVDEFPVTVLHVRRFARAGTSVTGIELDLDAVVEARWGESDC
jgi:hypothetical protein